MQSYHHLEEVFQGDNVPLFEEDDGGYLVNGVVVLLEVADECFQLDDIQRNLLGIEGLDQLYLRPQSPLAVQILFLPARPAVLLVEQPPLQLLREPDEAVSQVDDSELLLDLRQYLPLIDGNHQLFEDVFLEIGVLLADDGEAVADHLPVVVELLHGC